MKKNTTHLFQTRVPTAVAKTVKDKAKIAGMTPASYIRRLLMAEHHVPTPEEIAARAEAEARLAAERAERESYKPEEPSRVVLEDGRIAYDAMSGEIVPPDGVTSVNLGVTTYDDKTGFPGLPETRYSVFGVQEHFKPEAVRISPGFSLRNFYGGAYAMVMLAKEVPSEALELGKPQPDYKTVGKNLIMQVVVVNTSGRQRACRVRIIGREVAPRATEYEKQQVKAVFAHLDNLAGRHIHSFEGVDDRCACGEVRPQS